MSRSASACGLGALLSIAIAATGCTSGSIFGDTGTEPVAAPATTTNSVSTSGDLSVYLDPLRDLIEGDALRQAETARRIEESADIAPTTTNRLLYALALAVPGHPGSNADEARVRLAALLASSGALLPAERSLATIALRDVDERLVLAAAAADLRAELTRATQSADAETARQINSLLEENRQLQEALDDATSKLDAITSIEQSIQELENGPD